MTHAANDSRLQAAGDDEGYWLRPAEPNEFCTFCGVVFKGGEIIDTLFIVACMDCIAEIDERNRLKNEEQEDGTTHSISYLWP